MKNKMIIWWRCRTCHASMQPDPVPPREWDFLKLKHRAKQGARGHARKHRGHGTLMIAIPPKDFEAYRKDFMRD